MSDFADLSAALRTWPDACIPDQPLVGRAVERLRRVLWSLREMPNEVGSADLATLVRHVLRQESEQFGVLARLTVPTIYPWPDRERWAAYGCHVIAEKDGFFTVGSDEWTPEWLDLGDRLPPFRDAERELQRSIKRPVPSDPALRDVFGKRYKYYLSDGQAEIIRGVMLSPPGSVRLVAMPTGGGKSLIGLSAALLGEAADGGTSIVVVPTIALAYDQRDQARKLCPGIAIDAWESSLNETDKKAIRERFRAGTQRVLFAAPESLGVSLIRELFQAAGQGSLRAFIVDEAHMVAQWVGFRPEFQSMTGLWHELRKRCPEGRVFRTLLMTATLTSASFEVLSRLFDASGGMEVLASVHLRPEPDYFSIPCRDESEKETRILDALRNSPRPAILYVTEVDDAKDWHSRCLTEGWLRTGLIHGGCTGAARERTVRAWRMDELDIMVATSAFGLGMDKSDIRLVMHACVPETVDRFYQEVGRSGRDGCASVSLMVYSPKDLRAAHRMSQPSIITEQLGLKRWRTLWMDGARRSEGNIHHLNLNALREGKTWESEKNRDWNVKTVLQLVQANALRLVCEPPPECERQEGDSNESFAIRVDDAWQRYRSTCSVEIEDNRHLDPDFWEGHVGKVREESLATTRRDWQRFALYLRGRTRLDQLLYAVYRVRGADIEPGSADSPPAVIPIRQIACGLKPQLASVLQGITDPFVIILYPTSGHRSGEIARDLATILKRLAENGIREFGLPEAWRDGLWAGGVANPLSGLVQRAPEKFIIVRDVTEADPFPFGRLPVPRVSVWPPDAANQPLPDHLFLLKRPWHLILVPEECPDSRYPGRRLGDVKRPAVFRLATLKNLLNA